jgi:PAS domain S-box-containing protein
MTMRALTFTVYSLVVLVFVLDLFVPLGVAHGALYVIPIVAAVFTRKRAVLLTVAALAVLLCMAAYFFQHPPLTDLTAGHAVANRMISLVTILASGGLGLILIEQMAELALTRDELDRKQQLLSIAGRSAHFGGWSVDVRKGEATWTDETARLQGYSREHAPSMQEALGRYAPEHRERAREAFERCIGQGIPFDEEWQIQTPDNKLLWVRVIGEAVRDSDGQITGAHGSVQDIDARKRAEASAEVSRMRLRQLADTMPLFVWTADSSGRMDFLNRYGIEYAGIHDANEVLGDRWVGTLHPEDIERVLAAWTHAIQTGETYAAEFRLQRRDGEYRWHQAQATPVRDKNGNIDRWFGTCIDIHEQRQLADRLVHILENLDDVFYAFDADWRFIYINHRGEQLSGISREELLGEVIWDRFPDTRGTEFEHQYRTARATGHPVQFVEYYEAFGTWLDVKAFPAEDGLAVLLRDITEQRRAEEQLRQAQRMDSIGQLTGGIAHDFNNLLTVIMGNAEMAIESVQGDRQLRHMIQLVADAAQRGSDLTRRLLAFARRQALEPRAVDVNRLVADMETLMRRALGGNIHIELARGAGLWNAMIDPGQLEDALLNLCLNARDAIPDGGRLTIETYNASLDREYAANHEEVEPGQYVAIAVSDTGRGIPPEILPHVFEPFFTSRQKAGGTGLGLAMVYGFVKQSGGHVKIYSEVDQGTTVRLYLPRTHDQATETRTRQPRLERGSETVLLVEDDEQVRDYAARQLDALGYEVIQAGNGLEALEILESERPVDLLFTDVVMPNGISGRELAERAAVLRPGIKVLYTSGYTENAIVHHGRLDQGVHLLAKPYRRVDLASAIRRAME